MQVFARADSGVSAFWVRKVPLKNFGGILADIQGSADPISARKDLGASLWDLTTRLSGPQLIAEVRGDRNERVVWGCLFDIVTMELP